MITNFVYEKQKITYPYVYWENAFSNEEILKIDNYCNTDLSSATVVGNQDIEETRKVRKSLVKFVSRDNNSFWIFDKFNYVIESLNKKFYDFDLIGYDSFQYTLYDGNDEGKYDWHMDTVLGDPPDNMKHNYVRKLSVIMLLSDPGKDFAGGQFQYNIGSEDNAFNIDMKKGLIVAFPSFVCHRVTPVTFGTRKSIVIWVEGPKFR